MGLVLTSSAFADGGHIPVWYTCTETDASPPMGWAEIPGGTESLAIVCTSRSKRVDIFYHWLVYNIPPDVHGLDGKQPREKRLHKGICQGRNSDGDIGWRGPACEEERMLRFRLFALDTMLSKNDCRKPSGCLKAMDGHLLDEAALAGYTGYQEHHGKDHRKMPE